MVEVETIAKMRQIHPKKFFIQVNVIIFKARICKGVFTLCGKMDYFNQVKIT